MPGSGSFRFTCEVSGHLALSRITAGWTDAEIRGLLDGDEEALDEAVRVAQDRFADELCWDRTRTHVHGRVIEQGELDDA